MADPVEHDPIAVTFDRAHWLDRLQCGTANASGQTGYVAIVVDRGPAGDRYSRPRGEFHSQNQHLDAGVFAQIEQAQAYAERWRDAHLAKMAREHELRLRRGIELGTRMRALGLERGRLRDEAKAISAALKTNEDRQRRLVDEATDPKVEVDLRPSSDAWRVFDAPSESEGTLERNCRQLVIEATGLPSLKPAAAEKVDPFDDPPPPTSLHPAPAPTPEPEPEQPAAKLPPKVPGADGALLKPPAFVEVLAGPDKSAAAAYTGWLVEIHHALKGGGFSVVVVPHDRQTDPGVPTHLGNHQIRAAKRPRGAKPPTWPPEPAHGDRVLEQTATVTATAQPAAKPKAPRAWPAGVTDRNGKALRLGSWVRALGTGGQPGFDGKVTEALATDGQGFRLTIAERGNGAVRKAFTTGVVRITAPKANGSKAKPESSPPEPAAPPPAERPGLDPSQVLWPEDSEAPDL